MPIYPNRFKRAALAATVRIYNPGKNSEGSGVLLSSTGPFVYILTAHHIIAGADEVQITIFAAKDGAKAPKVYPHGRIVARSADIRDLALIRVPASENMLTVLPICPAGGLTKADGFPALALGCDSQGPTAIACNALARKKVRLKADGEIGTFWETPGTVKKGRSGGPLINERGYIIGICSGTSDGKGYFTHLDEIHRFLRKNAFSWLADPEK